MVSPTETILEAAGKVVDETWKVEKVLVGGKHC